MYISSSAGPPRFWARQASLRGVRFPWRSHRGVRSIMLSMRRQFTFETDHHRLQQTIKVGAPYRAVTPQLSLAPAGHAAAICDQQINRVLHLDPSSSVDRNTADGRDPRLQILPGRSMSDGRRDSADSESMRADAIVEMTLPNR